MKRLSLFITIQLFGLQAFSQPAWKLVKEKNGMKIFMASVENSKFKSIRVQAVFDGTIQKLMSVVGNIAKHPEWVYKAKTAYILKRVNDNDFFYYIESSLPWPLSNRDAIIHLTMIPDTVHHALKINAYSEPSYMSKKDGLVRIPFSKGSWYVTETANKLNIDYTFEVDPGGTLPAWLVNMLADKGPYESFLKLKEKLVQ